MILTYIDILVLTGRLDGLPLAIVIAGAFMRETGINTTEYLEYYQESWSDLQLQSSPIRQYQQGNMLQTWMISYYEIKKRDTDAAKLLLLLAHFDNRDLWYELIQGCCYSSDVPLWLKRITASGLAFNVSVRTLLEFSLLEMKPHRGGYMMHSVVQNWCLHVASSDENISSLQLRKMALIAVGHAIPEARDRNYPELQQRLIPHARHVCRGDWFNCDFEIWGAFHGLGELYFEQGSLKEAEEMFQRALLGREKTLSPEHTSTLDTVNCLGNLYKEQGKLREAEEMYQRALLGREKVLGPEHTSTLGTVNNIGNLCVAQGKLDRAAEMYQRALSGREKTLGPECPSTLSIFNNIGNLYRIQGKLEPAEQMYQRALLGRENALGLEHTSTLGTVTNLGNLYKDQGKLLLAEEMYRRALTGKEKVLGLEHMSTLNTVGNLGLLYKDQGKLKKAEEMYQRALAGFKKTLGSDHNKTRWVRGKLDELNIQMERGG
jgi:tetratricopeptide (TPR) repeat protein